MTRRAPGGDVSIPSHHGHPERDDGDEGHAQSAPEGEPYRLEGYARRSRRYLGARGPGDDDDCGRRGGGGVDGDDDRNRTTTRRWDRRRRRRRRGGGGRRRRRRRPRSSFGVVGGEEEEDGGGGCERQSFDHRLLSGDPRRAPAAARRPWLSSDVFLPPSLSLSLSLNSLLSLSLFLILSTTEEEEEAWRRRCRPFQHFVAQGAGGGIQKRKIVVGQATKKQRTLLYFLFGVKNRKIYYILFIPT